jgi:CubicO group peptidase (beta-lactamase class C family)
VAFPASRFWFPGLAHAWGEPTRLLRYPDISPDQVVFVYAAAGPAFKPVANRLSWFEISPSGGRAVVEARGEFELYVQPQKGGEAIRVTTDGDETRPARGAAQSLSGLDEYIARALEGWEVPGLSVSIVRNDSVIYAKGFGVKEVGKPDRVTEHTIFAIGSATKPFTAALVAQLVDEGKVRWDDRVQKYLSWFQVADPYVSRELTIRDLLSHRTGLERGDPLSYGTDYGRDEVIRRARYLEQDWGFREAFTYNNIMYIAAGELAAKVAGKSWDDLIQDRLFTPLGMHSSNTTIGKNAALTDIAMPHAGPGNRITPVPWRNMDNVGPAGSINSNAVDMAQWIRLQLNNGTFAGKQIISPASIREMHSANTVMLSDVRTDS